MAISSIDEPRDKRPAHSSETTPDSRHPEGPQGKTSDQPREIGGRKGPEPTRYGDWEKNGRCIDF